MNNKKKILLSAAAVLVVITIVCSILFNFYSHFSVPYGQGINSAAASQIALQHAGVSPRGALLLTSRAEFDDGRWEYEVKFFANLYEYSYQIDAVSGRIMDVDVEPLFSFFD